LKSKTETHEALDAKLVGKTPTEQLVFIKDQLSKQLNDIQSPANMTLEDLSELNSLHSILNNDISAIITNLADEPVQTDVAEPEAVAAESVQAEEVTSDEPA
ncbi:hypothetical protein EAY71_25875, partial [Vibrio anguillarum]|uniref:hypothetical protein n=1 Tax=Vibrio anguillarum TaxID=55601 RepID=UPI00188C6530